MIIFKLSKIHTVLAGILMMALLLCYSSQVQAAQAEGESDYTYTVTDGKAQITGYKGAGGAVTIPSTLGGAPVTSIGDMAFDQHEGLTSVSIPQGVISIGGFAFQRCTGLTSVSIPEGLTSIDYYAFANCTGLTTINIQGVTSIGHHAFDGCKSLTSITVATNNSNFKSVDGVLFNKEGTILITCPGGVTSLSIPQGVTSIGNWAFLDCSNLTSISILEGVTSIGAAAFHGCTGLTSISLPQSLTSIGDGAFQFCAGLTNVSIPSGVTSIGGATFTYCTGLATITFNSATTIIVDFQEIDTIPATTIILGFDTSTAKTYAQKWSRKFQVIGTTPDTSGMIEMKTASPIVGLSKVWTIKLKGIVSEASIKNKIYVTNYQGIKQATTCTVTTENGRSQIKVKPDKNYTTGDYMLWVRDIENVKGTKIKSQVYVKFQVQ